MKVLDFYNHQGHQYEFFKLGYDFWMIDPTLYSPNWNINHRPLNKNLKLVSLEEILDEDFDVVMYRTGSDESLVNIHKKRGAKIIHVAQTTFMPSIKILPDAIVWNSHEVFVKFSKNFKCKSFYIPHGYDSKEFRPIEGVKKNGRVLSLANMFKKRDSLLGYSLWKSSNDLTGLCDVFGHHNDDIGRDRISNFDDQIIKFSEYSAYLNTTMHSAMPRSRAEAMMCGMPLITTKNYGIDLHIRDDECFYVRSSSDVVSAINNICTNDSIREEYSYKSRSAAKREFGIDAYISRWKKVFSFVCK